MKLDKIRFAMLVSWISRRGAVELDSGDCFDIDAICDYPEFEPVKCDPEQLNTLMALMQEGKQKIEAIKQYRMMTGYGLKESKDAVEKYWPYAPKSNLDADNYGVRDAT